MTNIYINNFYINNNTVDLKIERDYIKSGLYKDDYWLGLLKYMICTI